MNPNMEMNNQRDENLKRIIHLMQTDDSVDAPADAIKWSKGIFRTRAAERKPSVTERILAVLKADLAPGKAVFGERSGTAQARQMLFEAGDAAIDLRIADAEGAFEVRGQVIGEGFEGCEVSLGSTLAAANERGEFIFKGVEPGDYDLVLRTDSSEIAIEKIRIS